MKKKLKVTLLSQIRKRLTKKMTYLPVFQGKTFPKNSTASFWKVSNTRTGKLERRLVKIPNKYSKMPK